MARIAQIFVLFLFAACVVEIYGSSRRSYSYGRSRGRHHDYPYSRHRSRHSSDYKHGNSHSKVHELSGEDPESLTPQPESLNKGNLIKHFSDAAPSPTINVDGKSAEDNKDNGHTSNVDGNLLGSNEDEPKTITINGALPNGDLPSSGNNSLKPGDNEENPKDSGSINVNGKIPDDNEFDNVNPGADTINVNGLQPGEDNKPKNDGSLNVNGLNPSGGADMNIPDIKPGTLNINGNLPIDNTNEPKHDSGDIHVNGKLPNEPARPNNDKHKPNKSNGSLNNNGLPNENNDSNLRGNIPIGGQPSDNKPNSDNGKLNGGGPATSDDNSKPNNTIIVNGLNAGENSNKLPSNDNKKPNHDSNVHGVRPDEDEDKIKNDGSINVHGLLPGGDGHNSPHGSGDIDKGGLTNSGKPDYNHVNHVSKPTDHRPNKNELPSGGDTGAANNNRPSLPHGSNDGISSQPGLSSHDYPNNNRYPADEKPGRGVNNRYPAEEKPGRGINNRYPAEEKPGRGMNDRYPAEEKPGHGINNRYPSEEKPGHSINNRYPSEEKPDHGINNRYPAEEKPGRGINNRYPVKPGRGGDEYPTEIPNFIPGKVDNGAGDKKENGSIMYPVYLPGFNGQGIYPGGFVSQNGKVPAFYIVMINGQATLVKNPAMAGSGDIGSAGIDMNGLIANWLHLGDGGSSGIGMLSPIMIGSQYPGAIAGFNVGNRVPGGSVIGLLPNGASYIPSEQPVNIEPLITEPVPVQPPVIPEPVPVPQPVYTYPVPQPSYPSMPYPYPYPSMWDNMSPNMNWPSIIDFFVNLGAHLPNQVTKKPDDKHTGGSGKTVGNNTNNNKPIESGEHNDDEHDKSISGFGTDVPNINTRPTESPKHDITPVVTAKPVSPTVTDKPVTPLVTKEPYHPTVTKKPVEPIVTKKPHHPTITEKPVEPIVTKEPYHPTITEKPEEPIVTKEPYHPTVTEKPVEPIVTKKPYHPTVTEKPVEPIVTKEPYNPTITEKPVEPIVTKKPHHPTVTEKPVEPIVTKEPYHPTITEKPVEPIVTKKPHHPTVTEKPVKPIVTKEPYHPTMTEKPVEPIVTKKPHHPTVTEKPVEPIVTKEPYHPTVTKKPVEPIVTKEPHHPTVTEKPGKFNLTHNKDIADNGYTPTYPDHLHVTIPSQPGFNNDETKVNSGPYDPTLINLLNVVLKVPNKASNPKIKTSKDIDAMMKLLESLLKQNPGNSNIHNLQPNRKPSIEDRNIRDLLAILKSHIGDKTLKELIEILKSRPGDKAIRDLFELLKSKSGDKPLNDLLAMHKPNIGDNNLHDLLALFNENGGKNEPNPAILSQLLLHLLDSYNQPNMNVLVEPGMDEGTRSTLILLLNLLASNLGSEYSSGMGYGGYYEPMSPANLYFLGHFPCDFSSIHGGLAGGQGVQRGLWQLLSRMYGMGNLNNIRLERSAEELGNSEPATPLPKIGNLKK